MMSYLVEGIVIEMFRAPVRMSDIRYSPARIPPVGGNVPSLVAITEEPVIKPIGDSTIVLWIGVTRVNPVE
jgi:hypothetical protein